MVKKCIVEYDELGNPIGLIDLKEFTSNESLKDFRELCKRNREEYLKRKADSERKANEEKMILASQIGGLENNIIFVIRAIKKIFGVKTKEEIESMIKEVEEYAKED